METFYTGQEAVEIFKSLENASKECLKALNIPYHPEGKTRSWKYSGGPIGLGIHYTGGVNPLQTMRWFNDPNFGNVCSSCHCIVFDQMVPELADLWPTLDASYIFKVPTILLAELTQATWHIRWANNRLFGIENRNAGYSGCDLANLNKKGCQIKDRLYEEYSRDQIAANIELGRLWLAVRRDEFKPEWICGHSQIWATKSDPGPMFPSMHQLRDAIWSKVPVDQLDMLKAYPLMRSQCLCNLYYDYYSDESGKDPFETEEFWHGVPNVSPVQYEEGRGDVDLALYRLGWPVDMYCSGDEELRRYIVYYQRSTLAYRLTASSRVLKVDGIVGPKTMASLSGRLKALRLC